MPPKVKISKQDIIDTALALLRKGGEGAVNARSIAAALGCSTQPIFSNFSSMEELEESVTLAAYECYLGALAREAKSGKYPAYKSFGMAYIRFAKEERELFRHLFMCDRRGKEVKLTSDFDESVEMIMKANSIPRELAQLIHLEMWVSVHGIATILATSFLELDTNLISDMLTDIYQGIRARHLTEGN